LYPNDRKSGMRGIYGNSPKMVPDITQNPEIITSGMVTPAAGNLLRKGLQKGNSIAKARSLMAWHILYT
jgi:hypothetical protein